VNKLAATSDCTVQGNVPTFGSKDQQDALAMALYGSAPLPPEWMTQLRRALLTNPQLQQALQRALRLASEEVG